MEISEKLHTSRETGSWPVLGPIFLARFFWPNGSAAKGRFCGAAGTSQSRGHVTMSSSVLAPLLQLSDSLAARRESLRPRRDHKSMGWLARRASDLACLKGALRSLRKTTPIAKHPTRVFPAIIDELAGRYGDAPALLSDRESFTYRQLAARLNRYARWALAEGIQKGDTICLMMPNRPEYMALWLGVTRVGGVVALINTNLTGATLAHCINAVTPKHIVVASELLDRFVTARALLTVQANVWVYGEIE